MGYYTNFEIRAIEDPNEAFDAFLQDLADEADMDEISFGYVSSVKWYDCDKDALKVSLKYPELLFVIEGDGEESDDI